jgi:hypothetical protein
MAIWLYAKTMKTTINLDDQLLQAAKQRALDTNTSLKEVLEQALRQLLRPAAQIGVPIRTLSFGNAGDPWQLSPQQLRVAAYPEQTTQHFEKRMGLELSNPAQKK